MVAFGGMTAVASNLTKTNSEAGPRKGPAPSRKIRSKNVGYCWLLLFVLAGASCVRLGGNQVGETAISGELPDLRLSLVLLLSS